jgi:hypothetical protein
MSEFKLTTPVAFIIFNRPDTTERVFAEIAKAKPTKLLVVADGARVHKEGEAEKVAKTRAIIDRVDWPCEVLTNYSDVNLGCKVRVSSGIDWVFEQVEEAIILEDDCLPDPTFFRFCQEMLDLYKNDQRIGLISGNNFQFGKKTGGASYYYSRYNHIWGWASWRRAWKHYDNEAKIWPELKNSGLLEICAYSKNEQKYWSRAFDGVFNKRIDTWDYQWTLTMWSQGMLSILPNVNLISNIGFGSDATHTKGASMFANLKRQPMSFPLDHPKLFIADKVADRYTSRHMFNTSILAKILSKLKHYIFTTWK